MSDFDQMESGRKTAFANRWREDTLAKLGGRTVVEPRRMEAPADRLRRLSAEYTATPLRLSDATLATVAGRAPLSFQKPVEAEGIAS